MNKCFSIIRNLIPWVVACTYFTWLGSPYKSQLRHVWNLISTHLGTYSNNPNFLVLLFLIFVSIFEKPRIGKFDTFLFGYGSPKYISLKFLIIVFLIHLVSNDINDTRLLFDVTNIYL